MFLTLGYGWLFKISGLFVPSRASQYLLLPLLPCLPPATPKSDSTVYPKGLLIYLPVISTLWPPYPSTMVVHLGYQLGSSI